MNDSAANTQFKDAPDLTPEDIANMYEDTNKALRDEAMRVVKKAAITVGVGAAVGAVGCAAWFFLKSSGATVEDAVESLFS